MTYCVTETKLLAKAGRELSEKLLPEPFKLWHADHSTGIQMTIVTAIEGKPQAHVWQGSIWHHSRYEFNDEKDIPGLQPDFEFARPVIEKYFRDVAAAVAERDVERQAARERADAAEQSKHQELIAAVRDKLAEQA